MRKEIKCIAFYLPQYHEIPENNYWWGNGFTEWTNVKQGKPLFEGHYQPKIPLNGNYYCLLDKDTLHWQANLAQKYGVFGFCYYHYWFKGGKKLLERPAEIMLKNHEINQQFCFCWANENWARTWDGGNNEIIMPQEYGNKDEWKEHLRYLLPFFKDKRYIKKDGAPIFLIYRPDIIPDLNKMLLYWKKEVKQNGFNDLCVIAQHPAGYFSTKYDARNISKFIMFEPHFTRTILQGNVISRTMMKRRLFEYLITMKLDMVINKIYSIKKKKAVIDLKKKQVEVNDYDEYWENILNRSWQDSKLVPGAFVDWDNIARKKNGMLFKNANPIKFEKYVSKLIDRCNNEGQEFLFINAWNEWGEGAYLEPDTKNGYGYLKAIKKALQK